MEEYMKLQKEYFAMFNIMPPQIPMVSINSPKYMEMIAYCIEKRISISERIISLFFDGEKYDNVVKNEEKAIEYFNGGK